MTDLEAATQTVQFLSVDAVEKANSGHPGTPMALAGIAVEIFANQLRYDPKDPTWPNRDRFVLSCGHASMLLYSVLHLAGYDVSLDDLRAFRQAGARTAGHPEHGHLPGVETTTGPLGQGIGNAVGMALASKLLGARLTEGGAPLFDYRVFVLASDGDVMEGVAMEASSLAGHLGLDNLVVVYDDNRITIDGGTELTFTEDVAARYQAMGWATERVDGHSPTEVRAALDRARARRDRPTFIVARTHIAIGAPTKQDTSAAHGSPLGAKEIAGAKQAAGFPVEPTFHVAEGAMRPFAARVAEVAPEKAAWARRVAALTGDQRALYSALVCREIPADLLEQLVRATPAEGKATRVLAGAAEQRLAALVPGLIGGSADLAGSTNTTIKGAGDVARGSFSGRNLHFGIREHGMGAILNGLALSGFLPFGSTFLVFSDYLRPSLRLSALMRQQVVYVFTHDSVFLGEDGPTHQPIEHLWALRVIPNVDVVRPADALETAAAWAHAAARRDGPTALALSRQNLPVLPRPEGFDPRQILDGAYVLTDTPGYDLVLVATGSEVHLALEARRLLEARGRKVRVVSAPCLEAFQRLPAARREEILGSAPRVSLEAGRTPPWLGLLGAGGRALGIDRFGASAPQAALAEQFGLTAERVVAEILGS
ncbi:MAG: transketolase [Deltaproteobacteria bacterium]|nr:transketolase [Deltaproteobacteria bacterium]